MNHVPSVSQTLRLGLFPVSHYTNYRAGLSLALGLIKRHGIQTILTEHWPLDKINIFGENAFQTAFFLQKKCSPFVFPPTIFRTCTGTHPRNLEAEMPPHISCPVCIEMPVPLPCSAFKYPSNQRGDEDASTGNNTQAEIQGLKMK